MLSNEGMSGGNRTIENMEKKKYNIIQFSLDTELQHGMIVSVLAQQTAKRLELSKEQCYDLAVAGLLHDVGKLELAKYVYRKGETLTIEEIKYVRTHPTLGYALLSGKGYSGFVVESILYHHENYDGSGYPSNLNGEDIPLGARILRICDVYAALTSDRPYRRAFDEETAIQTMIEEIKDFDLKIFLCFLQVIHDESVQERLQKCRAADFKIEEDMLWQ